MARAISIEELFNEDFKPVWLVREERELRDIRDKFLLFAFKLRYGNEQTCMFCRNPFRYFLVKSRKCYACSYCAKQLSPLAGSVLHKSKTPIKTWLTIAKILKDAPGTPAMRFKELGLTYKTAWRLKNVVLKDFKERGLLFAFIYEDLSAAEDLVYKYQFKFVRR